LPNIPIELVEEATREVAPHNQQVALLARFWRLLGRTLVSDAERSFWLTLGTDAPVGDTEKEQTAVAVYMAWRDDIHESWTAPTLILDAMLPEKIVRVFFPNAKIEPRISVAMPHAYVRQIIDRAMTADMLIPRGDPDKHPNPTRRANVERIRRFIQVRAAAVAPARVLVVCQLRLETLPSADCTIMPRSRTREVVVQPRNSIIARAMRVRVATLGKE
jgi:hypothetical protein